MKTSFSNKEGIIILENLIKAIQENKQYLSDIDGQIGDGDHGINMNKGFTLFEEELSNSENVNLSNGLMMLSQILMTKIGGSMGPLYGFFFNSLSEKCKGKEMIDGKVFGEMLEAIPVNLSKITKAQPDDKTLLDCLIPAVDAFKISQQDEDEFSISLDKMIVAAEEGKDYTKDLISKVGRSSRLGVRSRGVIDAGAASCNIILSSMAISIKSLLNS